MPSVSPGSSAQKARENADKPRRAGAGAIGARLAAAALILRALVLLAASAAAVITLGAIIRGATPHFDYIAGEVTKGIATVSLQTGVPASYGILTCDTIDQAIERAGTKAGNKGHEAALAAIEMANLFRALGHG